MCFSDHGNGWKEAGLIGTSLPAIAPGPYGYGVDNMGTEPVVFVIVGHFKSGGTAPPGFEFPAYFIFCFRREIES